MIRIHKIQKGFALVTSLMLLLLMTVMGIAITARSNLNTNMSVEYDRSEHVFFSAEAGIEHARRYLEYKTSNNVYPSNILGPLTTAPANRCLANYKDGIGSATKQYDTLGKDSGKYAYKFPPSQKAETMDTSDTCAAINKDPSLEENYRRMDCEIDASNSGAMKDTVEKIYKSYGFSYFIFYEGEASSQASSDSTGAGSVGTSTEYGAGTQDAAYYYKVISCGAGFDWDGSTKFADLNQIETLEARIKLEN